jgi:hypothetical protein
MKKRKATKSIIAGALLAGAALYFLGGKHSQTVQADSGRTTEAVAATAGARVLPTDPPLKVEPK